MTLDASHPAFNYYGRWQRGATAVTVATGAMIEFAYSGGGGELRFDVAGFTDYPGVFVQVDNGPIARTILAADRATVPLVAPYGTEPRGKPPFAVPTGRHHIVRLWVAAHSLYLRPATGRQWTNLDGALKFCGITLAPGGELVALPYLSRQIEFLGDSITQGLRLLYTGTEEDIENQVPYANWPQLVADLLGLKPVVTGFGGVSLTAAGSCGAPRSIDSLPYIYGKVPWTPPVPPEVIVIYEGANDQVTPDVYGPLYREYLAAVRKMYPAALIFAVVVHWPDRAKYAPVMRDAVAALGDDRIKLLDYSSGVVPELDTCDGGHLSPGGAVKLAITLANDIARHR